MMQVLLDAAGYVPVRVHSAAELKDARMRDELDALLVDNSDNERLPEWLEHARRDGSPLSRIPLIEMTDATTVAVPSTKAAVAAQHVRVDRHNRAEILRLLTEAMIPAHGKAA